MKMLKFKKFNDRTLGRRYYPLERQLTKTTISERYRK